MPLRRAFAGADPFPHLETIEQAFISGQAVPGQNLTFFKRVPARNKALPYTTAKHFNGSTVNGNVAIGLWTSLDGGVTLTRIGGTASTAQAGASQIQSIALTATIFNAVGLPLWISFSEDSATGTYSRATGWTGSRITDNDCRTINAYNQTADFAASGFAATTIVPWVQLL